MEAAGAREAAPEEDGAEWAETAPEPGLPEIASAQAAEKGSLIRREFHVTQESALNAEKVW
jgi:hypothetical protein